MNFPVHIGLSPKVIALMLCFLDYSRLQKILEEILEMTNITPVNSSSGSTCIFNLYENIHVTRLVT